MWRGEGGERGSNYRVQRAGAAHTNDNSINYFIQYFLYLKETQRQASGTFQGLCLDAWLKQPNIHFPQAPTQPYGAQYSEYSYNLHLGEKKLSRKCIYIAVMYVKKIR